MMIWPNKLAWAAYKVTDEQVEKVVQKTGNEKAAFELIVTAAVGAGFYHWQVKWSQYAEGSCRKGYGYQIN